MSHLSRGLPVSLITLLMPLVPALAQAPAAGAPATPDSVAGAIVDRAIAAWEGVRTLRAEFTQVIRDPMIGTDDTSRGELLQQKPNKFAMRWRDPAGDLIVSDGEAMWVYLPSSMPGQVVRAGVSGRPGQTPDVVAEFLERPRERFTITYERADAVGGRAADVLLFVPRERNAPYRRVLVWVDRGDRLLRRVELSEAGGAVRRVTLERLRVNTTIPASAFTFRPPAGVRVVDATR